MSQFVSTEKYVLTEDDLQDDLDFDPNGDFDSLDDGNDFDPLGLNL